MKRFTRSIASFFMAASLFLMPGSVLAQDWIETSYTYENPVGNPYEKLSHPQTPSTQTDGIVDCDDSRGIGGSSCSTVFGDWVYLNTEADILKTRGVMKNGSNGQSAQDLKNELNARFNQSLYLADPSVQTGASSLIKINMKSGEVATVIDENNGIIPYFTGAFAINGKLYFTGRVIDLNEMSEDEIEQARETKSGLPSIYEVDPTNDSFKLIYRSVDMDGYRAMKEAGILTASSALGNYNDSMIISTVNQDGVSLLATDDPVSGSFSTIATQQDLFNYPAYHVGDAFGGCGVVQVEEYNNRLYMTVSTTNPKKNNEKSYAILCGECSGDPAVKSSWTWRVVAGDQEKDKAAYPYAIDASRSGHAGARMIKSGGYLYIAEINDVSQAVGDALYNKDVRSLRTLLDQPVNIYRMDTDEKMTMVAGDVTETSLFSLSGEGSGFSNRFALSVGAAYSEDNQLYLALDDYRSVLDPVASFTVKDVARLNQGAFEGEANVIRSCAALALKDNAKKISEASRGKSGDDALRAQIEKAETLAFNGQKKLSDDQRNKLFEALKAGQIKTGSLSKESKDQIEDTIKKIQSLIQSQDKAKVDPFSKDYKKVLDQVNGLMECPELIKGDFSVLVNQDALDNITAFSKVSQYFADTDRGFDLVRLTDSGDPNLKVESITTNGFGDPSNIGVNQIQLTPNYLFLSTKNPFNGSQIWRRQNEKITVNPQEQTAPESGMDETLNVSSKNEIATLENVESMDTQASQKASSEASNQQSEKNSEAMQLTSQGFYIPAALAIGSGLLIEVLYMKLKKNHHI